MKKKIEINVITFFNSETKESKTLIGDEDLLSDSVEFTFAGEYINTTGLHKAILYLSKRPNIVVKEEKITHLVEI